MCLSNTMFIELQVREYRAWLEKEAEQIRMIRLAGKEHGRMKRRLIEKLANLLIFFGDGLKRRYCPESPAKSGTFVYKAEVHVGVNTTV